MDLLESGNDRAALGPRLAAALSARPPRWVVVLLSASVLGTTGAAVVAAGQVAQQQAREAARLEVDVLPAAGSSSTVRGVARGELELLLVNRRDRRVRLGALEVAVEGLRVLRVEPPFGSSLGPYEERLFRLAFVVPDCRRLVLPGVLRLSLATEGRPLERRELVVYDPVDAEQRVVGVPLAACPASARAADPGISQDVAVRPAGGTSIRRGVGAEGIARLEVRNAGLPLRLLSVDARLPGVRVTPQVLEGGRTLERDGLVIVQLRFRVDDCSRLQKTGRLVLRVEQFGAVQELGLRVTAEPAARRGPQVDLRVVLSSCD